MDDIGPRGLVQHNSSDGTSMGDRVFRYGSASTVGENISFGSDRGNEIVMQLFIDDGVPSRGHRTNLFSANFIETGANTGPHTVYRDMTTINYASVFGGSLSPTSYTCP